MKARKRFGQHFLKDKQILQNLITAINPQSSEHIVEIGPGHGELTHLLITNVHLPLDVIEIDRDLVTFLKNRYHQALRIHSSDVLNFDFNQIKKEKKLRLLGNLPYNISTPLLFHLFKQINHIQDMHFLFQKEVAERIIAKPGESHYSRLSIMTQYYCQATALMHISPTAFEPPPKICSTLVRLIPHNPLTLHQPSPLFATIVKEAFQYRRKTLSNALQKFLSAQQLSAIGIDPNQRPQALSIQDYIRISRAIRVE